MMHFVLTLACSMSKHLLFLAVCVKLIFPTTFSICKIFFLKKHGKMPFQNIVQKIKIYLGKNFEMFDTCCFKVVNTLEFLTVG